MSFLSSFDISGYGLSAQRKRVEVISSNIANAETTRTAEGGPYRRESVVFRAMDFGKVFKKGYGDSESKNQYSFMKYEDPLDEGERGLKAKPPVMSVIIDKIVRDDKPFKLKYDPNNVDANKDGYVAYPNINPVVEMADMIEATRAYQANIAAFNSTKDMAKNAISILQA